MVKYNGNFISINIAVSEAFDYFKSDMIKKNCSNYGKRINIKPYILNKPVCANYVHYKVDRFYYSRTFLLKYSYQNRPQELFMIKEDDGQLILNEILIIPENRHLEDNIFNLQLKLSPIQSDEDN